MANCNGWGLGNWGESYWGQGDQFAPVVISQSPPCGSENINKCAPIILKVASVGCSDLDLDCVRITLNGVQIYSGAGLTFGVDQNDGWIGACSANSSVTSESSSIYNDVWVFYIDCGCFECGDTVEYSGTFCTEQGKTLSVSCSFDTAKCPYIREVEEIDRSHIVLRFSTPLLNDIKINPALFNVNSYQLISTNLGIAEGKFVTPKRVFIEKGILPQAVILETDFLTEGASYQVVASSDIIDKFHQNLEERGLGTLVVRSTRVDDMLKKLPRTYVRRSDVNVERKVTPYHIAAVLGIENDRLGGDFGSDA